MSHGTSLRAALTDEQIRTLLDVTAAAGHLQAIDDRLRSADPDLADTVRRILREPSARSEAVPSSQKTIEIGQELWAAWASHVEQVADEKGPYANQEEHWHPLHTLVPAPGGSGSFDIKTAWPATSPFSWPLRVLRRATFLLDSF